MTQIEPKTLNDEDEYISQNPYADCIAGLQIPSQQRTTTQIMHMLPYMESLYSFMDIIKTDNKEKYNDILIELCKQMEYKAIPSNNFALRYGERGNHLYLILSGKVAILIVQNIKCYLNEEEYITHLLNLRKHDEIELLKYTLTLNNTQFYIDDNFDEFVQELSLKRNNTTHSKHFIKQVIETLRYIKRGSKSSSSQQEEQQELTPQSFIDEINYKDISLDKDSRKLLYIPQYVHVNDFTKGQIFGYFALENKSKKRTATLITLEDCEFAEINKETYELLLKTLFEKSRKQCYDIIYSFSIYQSIRKSVFENSYYNFFNYEHNERGTSIINETEPINKVYIIRNGDCSLSTFKSIYELNELIIIYKNYLGIPSTYEEQQNEEFLLSKNFKSNLFREFVFEKKRVNVIKINNRDVLGLDDMLIGKVDNVPHFTVNCESSICEYYTIDKKNYDILYSREKSIEQDQRSYICKKMLCYIERINTYKKRMFNVLESKDKKPLCVIKSNHLASNTRKINRTTLSHFELPKLINKNLNPIIIQDNNNNTNSNSSLDRYNRKKLSFSKKQKVEIYHEKKFTGNNRLLLLQEKRNDTNITNNNYYLNITITNNIKWVNPTINSQYHFIKTSYTTPTNIQSSQNQNSKSNYQ